MFSPITDRLGDLLGHAPAAARDRQLQQRVEVAAGLERQLGDRAHQAWNVSLRATKSVSELISTTAPRPLDPHPDQAFGGQPAGLLGGGRQALLAQPVGRDLEVALASVSAALQSIMPAPV